MKITPSLKGKLMAIALQFAIGGSGDLAALADALDALVTEIRLQLKG